MSGLAEVAALLGAAGAVLLLLGPPRAGRARGRIRAARGCDGHARRRAAAGDDLERLMSAHRRSQRSWSGAWRGRAGAWAVRPLPGHSSPSPCSSPPRSGCQSSSAASDAFLLLPLYVVLAGACWRSLYRAIRGVELAAIPLWIAAPAAALIGWASLSLLWALDLEQGSIALLFFLFPFAALLAVVARSPYASGCHGRSLCRLVGLATSSPRRPLPGVVAHARLRPGPTRRKRLHDVLPRYVAVQGSEHLRPPAGARADAARRRALVATRAPAADRPGCGGALRRPLLLVLPVESARALRDACLRSRCCSPSGRAATSSSPSRWR